MNVAVDKQIFLRHVQTQLYHGDELENRCKYYFVICTGNILPTAPDWYNTKIRTSLL